MDVPMQPSSFVDFWLTLPEQSVKMKKSGLSLKSDPSCPSMPPQQHTDGDDELGHEHPWRIIRAEKESVRACPACKWILPRFSSLWIPDDKARRMINGTEGWNTAGNYIPNIWMDCLHFMVHQLLPSSFLGFQTHAFLVIIWSNLTLLSFLSTNQSGGVGSWRSIPLRTWYIDT